VGMALAGHTFALSAGGSWITQRELGELIKLHGGQLSKIVHKRIDFLVATPQAVRRNTQVHMPYTNHIYVPNTATAAAHGGPGGTEGREVWHPTRPA